MIALTWIKPRQPRRRRPHYTSSKIRWFHVDAGELPAAVAVACANRRSDQLGQHQEGGNHQREADDKHHQDRPVEESLARLGFIDLGTAGSPYAHDGPYWLLSSRQANAKGREGVPAAIQGP